MGVPYLARSRPGRPGQLPTQGSHRSGLAQLRHPARPFTDWLASCLAIPEAIPEGFGDRTVEPQSVPPVSPAGVREQALPSLHRVPRKSSSPASAILWSAPTPCRPSGRASLPSLGCTTSCAQVLLPPLPSAATGARSCSSGSSSRKYAWRRQGLPGSWRTRVPLPGSPTPAGPTPAGHTLGQHGPRLFNDEDYPHAQYFRGSMAGFGTGCLRFAGWITPPPRKTRFWWLARPCQVRLVTHGVPMRGFRSASYISSSSPRLRLAQ